MQKIKMIICILALCLISGNSFAEHSDEQVVIKISDAAVENYGIKTVKVKKDTMVSLPRSAFAFSKNEYFAYAKKDGGFVEIDIHSLNADGSNFAFLNNLNLEEFVVDGAKYLRIIFLSQQNPTSGHSH